MGLQSAFGQLADPAGFVEIIDTYRLFGIAGSEFVAAALIAGGLTAGIGLLAGDPASRQTAGLIAVAVAVAWTVAVLQAFARGLDLDNCGCFGVYLGQPLRRWVLIEDVEFVALALWVRGRARSSAVPAEAAKTRDEGG